MRESSRWRRAVALGAALAMAVTACGGDDEPDEVGSAPTETMAPTESGTQTEGGGGMAVSDVTFDIGVTEEPCPGTPNQDNGCIYLGVLSDFTGPFSVFGTPLTEGNQRFWEAVNADGGVGGLFDVVITDENIGDTGYNPQTHVEQFNQIEPNVLALAQTLGTPQTLGIAEDMADLDMIGAVATWWSGWPFNDNIVEYGSNYCMDAMNGVDWVLANLGAVIGEGEAAAQLPESVETAVVIYFPGDYGGDALAGVQEAAEANGIEILAEVAQVPIILGGDVTAAVTAVVQNQPDLIWVTTGPTELGQIMGGAFTNGFQGGFYMGSHPTFNPGLLESDAAPLVLGKYAFVGPHQAYDGESAAHEAMRAAFGDTPPANDGGTFGWMMEYPLLAALERAVENGDLTRAGLLAAKNEVEVSFEGAMPSRSYSAEPNGAIQRETFIGKADPAGTTGVLDVESSYIGPTVEAYELTSPCVDVG